VVSKSSFPHSSTATSRTYIPALRYTWLTRFYDPLIGNFLKEKKFKQRLVDAMDLHTGQCALDLGCGTATLTMMIKQSFPESEVVGLDGDPDVLRIARRKAAAAGADIEFVEAMAFDIPFEDSHFQCATSSLVFHHLSADDKRRTLREIHRVLAPGGTLNIADWGKAQNLAMRGAFLSVQLLDGFATTSENVQSGLVPLLEETGFVGAKELHREMTLLGTLSHYSAAKAPSA